MTTLNLGKNYGTPAKFGGTTNLSSSAAMTPDAWGGAGADRFCTCNVKEGTETYQQDCMFMRFDISSLPAGATISDATVYLKAKFANANNMVLTIRQFKYNWGINDNTGYYNNLTENPATHGQATHRRSYDFNGAGGDITWTGGNLSVPGDCSSQSSATTLASQTANAWYGFGCTTPVNNWYSLGQPNYGFMLWKDTTGTQASAPYYWCDRTAASAPYLVINYTTPTNIVLNSMSNTL